MHGNFIADILKKNNISQNELARRLEVDPATINRFAQNQIRISASILWRIYFSDLKFNKKKFWKIAKENYSAE